VYPLETIHELTALARRHGLAVHLDGARLFNASTKTGVSVAEYAAAFDTVSFCLSKGLGAPVGSMVVSDTGRIQKLRRLRKVFGGGMRQVGILAAAGIYALEHHVTRLSEDHANAQHLAQLLHGIPGVTIDVESVETNMVMFQVPQSPKSTEQLLEDCREAGVLLNAVGDRSFRAVTHLDVNREDMEAAGQGFARVFASL
jgi:threonine aldolase